MARGEEALAAEAACSGHSGEDDDGSRTGRGTFLRTWRSEWAGLSRARPPIIVAPQGGHLKSQASGRMGGPPGGRAEALFRLQGTGFL